MTAQNFTGVEGQSAAHLPMTVQLALSAGIASLRGALASGQMPTMDMPAMDMPTVEMLAVAHVEILHPAPTASAVIAPNVAVCATWLAALVRIILPVLAGVVRPTMVQR